jgi:hypothetical protein
MVVSTTSTGRLDDLRIRRGMAGQAAVTKCGTPATVRLRERPSAAGFRHRARIARDAVIGRATVTDHARREVKSGAIEYE